LIDYWKVILIFTANRTEKFLGCARMMNIYVSTVNRWQGAANILLGENFGIEWLRKGKLEFTLMGDMTNPLTGESITKSRDCQEVPKVLIASSLYISKNVKLYLIGYW
jgi:hypothetical protein